MSDEEKELAYDTAIAELSATIRALRREIRSLEKEVASERRSAISNADRAAAGVRYQDALTAISWAKTVEEAQRIAYGALHPDQQGDSHGKQGST